MCIVLYIPRSAMRCITFGVAVFEASMLDCREVNLPNVYVHCSIYIERDLPLAVPSLA